MKKPNAVLHMMGYGLVYGWLLAMLFIMWIAMLGERNGWTTWYVSLQEFSVSARLAFIFGAVPGAIMGFIEGWILWLFTRHVKPQIHPEQLAGIRILTVSIIGALTFAGMAGVLLLLFPIVTLASLYILIPATLAGGAAAYAVHRYLLKLRTWANIGKTKNDYKAKNQLADTNFTYDESPVTAKDEAQVNELRSR